MSHAATIRWDATSSTHAEYQARAERAAAALRNGGGGPLRLAKDSSNLFRDRATAPRQRLDLRELHHVLAVDARAGSVECEALISYDALVDATLPHGLMPAVAPQFKGITAGGAVAGVGIEASSFREGLVHDTLIEADVLLADGRIVTCRPDNEHRDLFLALPNSYGTLGYALRLVLRTRAVKRFVAVEHRRFDNARHFFAALEAACDDATADFVDGVAFAVDELVLNVARQVDTAPAPSDYTGLDLYWHSLRDKPVDALTIRDWLWRWDTDWFWCSKNFGLEHRWLRRLVGRKRLNSRTYTKWMRLNARWGLARRLSQALGWRHVESVIQDVDIPAPRAEDFLGFLLAEIGIVPIWICPIRAADPARPFTLYPLTPGIGHVNFGFWDVARRRAAFEPGHFNRLVEQRVIAAGGIKSLYSESFFTREEFARAYGMDRYAALKARYDPGHRLPGLYEKCVLRA
jgi:FAD/FMN-containing dehydrogenase